MAAASGSCRRSSSWRPTLADDGTSCDQDGVLDNGETGTLFLTVCEPGPEQLESDRADGHVDQSARHVPARHHGELPAAAEGRGEHRIDPGGVERRRRSRGRRLPDLDRRAGARAAERLERDGHASRELRRGGGARRRRSRWSPRTHGWTIARRRRWRLPNITSWQRRALSPTRHVWWGPDNNGQIDGDKADAPDEQFLVSPPLQVGTASADDRPSSIDSRSRSGSWDGGVVEISTDGGATWTDIGATRLQRRDERRARTLRSAPSRPAFVEPHAPAGRTSSPVALNLGTAYANQRGQDPVPHRRRRVHRALRAGTSTTSA